MSFADRLRISRKEKGYSQERLAEELEVSRQSITKWETGTAYPELKKLLQLSVCLDKKLDWLLFDEQNELAEGRELSSGYLQESREIHDMKSLKMARRDRLICSILGVLNGMEFRETAEEEDFTGNRVYVVFESRMYMESDGIDPRTGKAEKSFVEMKPEEIMEVLIRHAQDMAEFRE